MRKRLVFFAVCAAFVSACSSGLYEKDVTASMDAPYKADAVVTVRQAPDGTVYFSSGKLGLLYPSTPFEFEGECRALASVTVYAEEIPLYGHRVDVHWLENLDRGAFLQYPSEGAGDDGIDVMAHSWITSVEDGYLTVNYKAWWGADAARHDITLVQGADPYELTLYHDAHGESRDEYSEGIIYFDINSLPPTEDGPHRLKLNWTTTDGKAASAEFEFETRK